jgi:hypothetical protein
VHSCCEDEKGFLTSGDLASARIKHSGGKGARTSEMQVYLCASSRRADRGGLPCF